MVTSILKIVITQNTICDNLVGFPKSGHKCSICIYKLFTLPRDIARYLISYYPVELDSPQVIIYYTKQTLVLTKLKGYKAFVTRFTKAILNRTFGNSRNTKLKY